jgi:hypothetical protein
MLLEKFEIFVNFDLMGVIEAIILLDNLVIEAILILGVVLTDELFQLLELLLDSLIPQTASFDSNGIQ